MNNIMEDDMKKIVSTFLSLCILFSSVVIQTELTANAYTFEKEINGTQGTVLCPAF